MAEKKKPTIAISIVTWNSAKEIRNCLKNLANLGENWQVWLADNNSKDNTVEIVKTEFPFVNVIANVDNKGFAEANNQIINQTKTDYVLLLNPDTEAAAEDLEKTLEIIETNPRIGLLGVKLENGDGSLQISCYHYPTLWKNFVDSFDLFALFSQKNLSKLFAGEFFDHREEREVDWVMGAFMFVRRKAIAAGGAIPEDYFMFAEDLDWCRQINRGGYEVWFSPKVSIKHQSNKSAGQLPSNWRIERTVLSKHLFCLKNFGAFRGRLIQMCDYLGTNYKIFRLRLNKQKPEKISELKLYREQNRKSLFMSRKKIKEILLTR